LQFRYFLGKKKVKTTFIFVHHNALFITPNIKDTAQFHLGGS